MLLQFVRRPIAPGIGFIQMNTLGISSRRPRFKRFFVLLIYARQEIDKDTIHVHKDPFPCLLCLFVQFVVLLTDVGQDGTFSVGIVLKGLCSPLVW